MTTLKYAVAIISLLLMGTALKAQNPWSVDIPDQQIFINPAATDPKVGIGTDDPSERLEVIGTSLLRGSVGVNTSNPTTELSVRGQMSMSTIGFATSQQDKISLFGNRLGQDNMAGFGFENETVIGAGGAIETQPVLYSKAHFGHRWYINNNADGGTSASMVLEPTQLGVFTSNPMANLHIQGGNIESQILLAPSVGSSGGNAELLLAEDDDFTYGMKMRYDGSDNKMYFQGKSVGGLTVPHLSIERDNGDVAIGYGTNAVPAGYKLAVDGGIICEEVNVQLSGSWPDYVFEDDYNLMSIGEVAKSIEANGHLPGIPSAAEMETSGLDIADMQTRMMEKIEELTLYIITLQEQIDDLQAETK